MKIPSGGRDGVVSSVSRILNREGCWWNETIYGRRRLRHSRWLEVRGCSVTSYEQLLLTGCVTWILGA